MEIRAERPEDIADIRYLTEAAFMPVAHSDQTEAEIIEALRADNALTVSLVAIEDDELVGHVAFSPVTIDGRGEGWYGLGPVAVRPDAQRQGIGEALVRRGLKHLQALGAQGCVVLGAPDFYARFGFDTVPGLELPGVAPEYFQCLTFGGKRPPRGRVAYHSAFDAA